METKRTINSITLIFSLIMLFFNVLTFGQTGISTHIVEPFSVLEVSTVHNKGGFRLPQLTTVERYALEAKLNTTTAKGLMVFNITTNCVETWNGTTWISQCGKDCSVTASIIGSGAGVPNSTANIYSTQSDMIDYVWTVNGGTITSGQGTDVIHITWGATGAGRVKVSYTDAVECTAAINKNVSINCSGVPITIVGLGTSISNLTTIYSTKSDMIDYVWTVTGGTIASGQGTAVVNVTWDAVGTGNIKLSYTNDSCNVETNRDITIMELPTASGLGVLSGRDCFDIAISNDDSNSCGTLAVRTTQKADFTQAVNHTQIYTFTPSWTISNVRFLMIDPTGKVISSITPNGNYLGNNISGPCTATVVYQTTLNNNAKGTYTDGTGIYAPLTADIIVVYNDKPMNTGTDKTLKLNVTVKDCSCCGAYIAPGVWKAFMCHNLGGNTALDPFTPAKGLNGDYYKWGKVAPSATVNTPGGSIQGWNNIVANPAGSWSSVKTPECPCPEGYRVPTKAEWKGVITNNVITPVGTWLNTDDNFTTGNKIGKGLYLPAAGGRYGGNNLGAIAVRGYVGHYWGADYVWGINFSKAVFAEYNYLATYGLSVRCISIK